MTGPDDPNWRWEFRVEDFVYARLTEAQQAAETMPPGPARDAELHRIDSLYLIASQHNIWVDARGRSAASCITCTPAAGGVPCYTIRGLARLWNTHPDYRPGWNEHIDEPRQQGNTYEDYKQRSTIYQRREAELDAFYARFDLEQTGAGERWRCKQCGAVGEEWRPILGSYDYPHAMGTAAHQHPTCLKSSTNEETRP